MSVDWSDAPPKEFLMKRLTLILIAGLLGAVGLSACNTFEGIGKDVQKAGETLESAAKKK
jgi:predicted small secreted protein